MTLRRLALHSAHPLLAVEKARAMLAEAIHVDEVKHVRDVAVAMRAYARTQQAGREIALDAGEIIYRADRRIGELSAGVPKAGNGKSGSPSVGGPTGKESVAREHGIAPQRAREYEAASRLPELDSDRYLAACHEAKQCPSTLGAVALARLTEPERAEVFGMIERGEVAPAKVVSVSKQVAKGPADPTPFHILIATGDLKDRIRLLAAKWPSGSGAHLASVLRDLADEFEGDAIAD